MQPLPKNVGIPDGLGPNYLMKYKGIECMHLFLTIALQQS